MRARALVLSATSVEQVIGAIVAADARAPDGRVLLRKGTRLGEAHRQALHELLGVELHLVEPEPGEIEQDDVARELARALAGPGTAADEPRQGQARIRATRRGLLRVDAEAVRKVNRLAPLLCFTQPDGQVVLEGDEVGGTKAAALATQARLLERAKTFLSRAPALAVRAFTPRKVSVVVTERLEAKGRAMVIDAVRRKVGWYGSELSVMNEVPHESGRVAEALRASLVAGADLLLVSGANALDPLDPVFAALRDAGGEVLRWGVPAHPGSMVWAGSVDGVSVLGVATCSGFGKSTALDLVLARVLAGEDVVRAFEDVGHGGLAEGQAAAARFPPYDRG